VAVAVTNDGQELLMFVASSVANEDGVAPAPNDILVRQDPTATLNAPVIPEINAPEKVSVS
jgi:hypothetical protein